MREEIYAVQRPRPPWIDAEIGGGIAGRSLFFSDDIFMRLRPYSVPIIPAARLAVQFYPAAGSASVIASGIGIVASGEYSFLFASTDRQGRSYPTFSFGFSGGLRWRYKVTDAVELGATVSYRFQNFSINRDSVMAAPAEGIPNVTYHAVSLGLDSRLRVAPRFAVLIGGSYLIPVATGELGAPTFFPRLNGGGADANLALAFRLSASLELRVGGEWRRFFFKMNPMLNDPLIAGGAADDSYRATISIAIRR